MKIDFHKAMENIIDDIKDFVWVWSQKYGIPDADLLEWKNGLMKLIYYRIITLKIQNNNNRSTGTSSMKRRFIKNCLQQIYDHFKVAPIKKANGNDQFIPDADIFLPDIFLPGICKCFLYQSYNK